MRKENLNISIEDSIVTKWQVSGIQLANISDFTFRHIFTLPSLPHSNIINPLRWRRELARVYAIYRIIKSEMLRGTKAWKKFLCKLLLF